MSLLDTIAADAAAVIADVGRTATVTVTSGGTYSPATGEVTGTTETTATVTISPLLRHRKGMDTTGTRTGGGYFLLAADGLAFTPTQGQKWTIGTETWTVLEVWPIEVSAATVAYRLVVERGGR